VSTHDDERFPGMDDEPDFDPLFAGEGGSYPTVQEPEDREHAAREPLRIVNVRQGDDANTGNASNMLTLRGSGLAIEQTPFEGLFRYPRHPPGKPSPKLVQIFVPLIQSDSKLVAITDVFVELEVVWGVDGARQMRRYNATKFKRLPIVADFIEVSARLRSRSLSGAPPAAVNPAITAQVNSFVGPGVDGQYPIPTDYSDSTQSTAAVLIPNQCRVAMIQAYRDTATTPRFFLIFDKATAPAGGDVSVDGGPLPPVGGAVKFPYLNGRQFVNGCAVAVSSTTPAYTAVAETAVINFEECE